MQLVVGTELAIILKKMKQAVQQIALATVALEPLAVQFAVQLNGAIMEPAKKVPLVEQLLEQ